MNPYKLVHALALLAAVIAYDLVIAFPHGM